jgi:hypothetical protein
MNFLETHPATLLWWEQREKCRACAFHYRGIIEKGPGGERCKAVPTIGIRNKLDRMYCIDARLPKGPCGPNAKLFKEKS